MAEQIAAGANKIETRYVPVVGDRFHLAAIIDELGWYIEHSGNNGGQMVPSSNKAFDSQTGQ